jgi:hypothetical protein
LYHSRTAFSLNRTCNLLPVKERIAWLLTLPPKDNLSHKIRKNA